ncbi:MAG: diguanylate cyclase [Sulfurimonadaceae bacterium]|nr:diguanylate cyclase [Sulfurimonadaceae bacterium]
MSEWRMVNVPLHAVLEASGGVIALTLALIIYLQYRTKMTMNIFNWSATSLLAMGIFDIVHGAMRPGELFVWLHSLAVFFGGLFFLSVWIDVKHESEKLYRAVPLSALMIALFISLVSLLFPQHLPSMFAPDGGFSVTANWLNLIGGIGFLAASLKFSYRYLQTGSGNMLLFSGMTMLFGIAGLLFVSSVIWDMQWWLWHFLRLLAYIVAFTYLYREYSNRRRQLQRYIDLVDENVITSSTDTKGMITKVSKAFCQISGYSKEELIGQAHSIVRHSDMSKDLYKDLWHHLKAGQTWKGTIKNLSKDGSSYWVDVVIYPDFNDDGEHTGYTAIRHNITDKKKVDELLIADELTGIYNRRYFNERFPATLKATRRNNEYLAFVMLDIDYFKQYNDTYGHHEGDRVLKEVGSVLNETMKRSDDTVFRLGGEEFGILIRDMEPKEALLHCEALRQNIMGLKIEHKASKVDRWVTVSMGLCVKRAGEIPNEDALYKEADELLYRAKASGRNMIVSNHEVSTGT